MGEDGVPRLGPLLHAPIAATLASSEREQKERHLRATIVASYSESGGRIRRLLMKKNAREIFCRNHLERTRGSD